MIKIKDNVAHGASGRNLITVCFCQLDSLSLFFNHVCDNEEEVNGFKSSRTDLMR